MCNPAGTTGFEVRDEFISSRISMEVPTDLETVSVDTIPLNIENNICKFMRVDGRASRSLTDAQRHYLSRATSLRVIHELIQAYCCNKWQLRDMANNVADLRTNYSLFSNQGPDSLYWPTQSTPRAFMKSTKSKKLFLYLLSCVVRLTV